MRIYFVRHGEGEHNVKKLYSTPNFSLTEKGKQQAKATAQRVKNLPIEIIITSSYKRTLQTTEIINKDLNKKVVITDLAIEIKRPKEIVGRFHADPDVKKIKDLMDQNAQLKNWHYSDEENFTDLKKRAKEFIKYLESFNEEHILVVSHLVFIQMVILVMLVRDDLMASTFVRGYRFLELETSGLTICEKADDWKLITWNDQSHLADNSETFSG